MNKVQMVHPTLPGQAIEVREDAVFHYERGGWQLANKREADTPSTPSTAENTPSKPSTKKGESTAG